MSGIVRHASALPPSERLQELYRQVEEVETAAEAADLANRAHILREAVRASDSSLEVQNQAAQLRLTAERKLGELLSDTVRQGVKSLPDGINATRSHRAQRLAQIPADDWSTYIHRSGSEGTEITYTGMLRLAPRQPRTETKSLADTYVAPPIDVQLARELGLEVSEHVAEVIVSAIQEGLRSMTNPKQAFVWAKYHGIQDDGTIGDAWVFAQIAARMGNVTREYAENLYYRASHHIRGAIAIAALNELHDQMLAK